MWTQEYYDSIPAVIGNPEAIPLLLLAGHRRQRIEKNGWLSVKHVMSRLDSSPWTTSVFHTIDGSSVGEFENTLNLRGKNDHGKDIFAILRCNKIGSASITLSPVPFGPNGKPELPEIQGGMLLETVRVVLDDADKNRRWAWGDILQSLPGISQEHAQDLVCAIETIGVLFDQQPAMTPKRFTEIFGVELPAPKLGVIDVYGKTVSPKEGKIGDWIPLPKDDFSHNSWRRICQIPFFAVREITNRIDFLLAERVLIISTDDAHIVGVIKDDANASILWLVEWTGKMNYQQPAQNKTDKLRPAGSF